MSRQLKYMGQCTFCKDYFRTDKQHSRLLCGSCIEAEMDRMLTDIQPSHFWQVVLWVLRHTPMSSKLGLLSPVFDMLNAIIADKAKSDNIEDLATAQHAREIHSYLSDWENIRSKHK